jgi:hypothetical protein
MIFCFLLIFFNCIFIKLHFSLDTNLDKCFLQNLMHMKENDKKEEEL